MIISYKLLMWVSLILLAITLNTSGVSIFSIRGILIALFIGLSLAFYKLDK